MSFWGLNALRAITRAPVYFELTLYVHITSILATPLLRAFEQGGIVIVPHVL